MRISWLFVLLFEIINAYEDVCGTLSPGSFCLESGICSHSDTTTCDMAYISASTHLLKLIDDIPIVVRPVGDNALIAFTLALSRNAVKPQPIKPPAQLANTQEHLEFVDTIAILARQMYMEFPRIRYVESRVRNMTNSAKRIGTHASMSPAYGHYFLRTLHVGLIRQYFRLLIEYMTCLRFRDPMRRAIFANLVPYTHAWMSVHRSLRLPSPFLGSEYLEFLTEVSRYDPLYETSEELKSWIVPWMDSSPTIPWYYMTIVPPDEFPLDVLNFLDLPTNIPIDEDFAFEAFDQIGALVDNMYGIDDCEVLIDHFRAAIYFMHDMPGINEDHRETFCEFSQEFWQNTMLMLVETCGGKYKQAVIPMILDLVRICSTKILSLESRSKTILPFILQRDNTSHQYNNVSQNLTLLVRSISVIPVNILRGTVRVFGDFDDHISLLSQLVSNLSASIGDQSVAARIADIDTGMIYSDPLRYLNSKSGLMGMGAATALILVEKDPLAVLTKLFLDESVSYRNGFCSVVNCLAIDTLFDSNEILLAIEYLRNVSQ